MERTRRNQVVQLPRTLSEMYPVKHGKACNLAPVFKTLKPGQSVGNPLGSAQLRYYMFLRNFIK
uniref:SFRICE_021040 n=1 Tax=Spodoptera frugiperda TaxID=7108 RepID=A0A2H1WB34_SPOFR